MPPRAEALPVERYPSLRHLPPTRDPVKAAASVAALVREWSPASKRCGLGRTIPQQFRSTSWPPGSASCKIPMTDADAIDFACREVGGMTVLAQHTALSACRGDVLQALHAAPNARRAAQRLATDRGR